MQTKKSTHKPCSISLTWLTKRKGVYKIAIAFFFTVLDIYAGKAKLMELHPGVIDLSHAIETYRNNVTAYEQLGAIRTILHPTEPFMLFNYTDAAAHAGTWNAVEQISRGIIFNYQTAQVVAYPFFKFFNLNERPETSLLALPDEACEITIKLARQCLSRRIASIEEMRREVQAWQEKRNRAQITINWRFTTEDARIKLKRLYPSFE